MKDDLKELQQEYNTDELIENVVRITNNLPDDDKEVILKLMDYGTALEMIILREKENESKRTRLNNKE